MFLHNIHILLTLCDRPLVGATERGLKDLMASMLSAKIATGAVDKMFGKYRFFFWLRCNFWAAFLISSSQFSVPPAICLCTFV